MKLIRLSLVAGFAFTAALAASLPGQTTVASLPPTNIRPLITFNAGPAPLQSRRFDDGGVHWAMEVSAGMRKRVGGVLGFIVSANGGKMLEKGIGAENAVCRIRIDGKPGCYPNSPILNWFGASAGAEAYLGKTILGLQFGPTSVGAPDYERQLIAGSPTREWGIRSQFDAVFPVYRQVGLILSATDRYVPSVLNDKWHVTSFTFGMTLR